MLSLTKVRELTLRAPPEPRRPCHLSAASGLVRVGAFLYVVADDEYHLGVFPAAGDAPGELIRMLPGALPDAPEPRKAAKPDLEALTLLPSMPGYPAGALLALGSGSRRNRRTGALLALDARGAVMGDAHLIDLSGVIAALHERLGKVNIEGAVVPDKQLERLLLLQRGNHPHSRNALVGVSLAAVLQRPESAPGAGCPMDIRDVDLGTIDGIPLCFTDGAALPDGSLVFTAIAEAATDSYEDGPCVGAAIGVAGSDGTLRFLQRLDQPHKIEGVDAHVDGDILRLLLVTDADDAGIPAMLYTTEIPGYPFKSRS